MSPFFTFKHLHCCISSRYAICTARGHEGHYVGVEPEDGVGGPIPTMEGPLECMPRVDDVPQDGAS